MSSASNPAPLAAAPNPSGVAAAVHSPSRSIPTGRPVQGCCRPQRGTPAEQPLDHRRKGHRDVRAIFRLFSMVSAVVAFIQSPTGRQLIGRVLVVHREAAGPAPCRPGSGVARGPGVGRPTIAQRMAPRATRVARLWQPKRVLVTRSAYERAHGRTIVDRCTAAGVDDIEVLSGDRLPPLGGDQPQGAVRQSRNRRWPSSSRHPVETHNCSPFRPVPTGGWTSAEGCPAHCQYCYLAGSLTGPPITRAYANLRRHPGQPGRGTPAAAASPR